MPREIMPPSISAELLAMQQAAEGMSAKEKRRARAEIEVHRAYQRLFFDANGQLKDDARIVLDDMTHAAALGFASPTLDYGELATKEGKRRLLLHIFGRFQLTPEQVARLERSLIQEDEDAG